MHTMVADFSKEQEKLAKITSQFFLRDGSNERHPIWRTMNGAIPHGCSWSSSAHFVCCVDYDTTIKTMTNDVPSRMKTLLQDEVVEVCKIIGI